MPTPDFNTTLSAAAGIILALRGHSLLTVSVIAIAGETVARTMLRDGSPGANAKSALDVAAVIATWAATRALAGRAELGSGTTR